MGDDLWCRTDAGLSRLRIKHARLHQLLVRGDRRRADPRLRPRRRPGVGRHRERPLQLRAAQRRLHPLPASEPSLEGKSVAGRRAVQRLPLHHHRPGGRAVPQGQPLASAASPRPTACRARRGRWARCSSGGLLTLSSPTAPRSTTSSATCGPRARCAGHRGGEKRVGAGACSASSTPRSRSTCAPSSSATSASPPPRAALGFGQRARRRPLARRSRLRLDYGQLELPGIRDLQFKARVPRAPPTTSLREVRVEDKLQLPHRGGGAGAAAAARRAAQARLATEARSRGPALTADAAACAAAPSMRDFLTGPRQEIYPLSQALHPPRLRAGPGRRRAAHQRHRLHHHLPGRAARLPRPGAGRRPLGHRGRVRVRPDAEEGAGRALAPGPAARGQRGRRLGARRRGAAHQRGVRPLRAD